MNVIHVHPDGGHTPIKKAFEDLLIEQCSPTLAGLKTANLFCYVIHKTENISNIVEFWDQQLSSRGIRVKKLRHCIHPSTCLIYVYREKSLNQYLRHMGVAEFLQKQGYNKCVTPEQFIKRLSAKLESNDDFPHEIGLFLGYPLEDVVGFIKNKGHNCHCSGYWKVYNNPQATQKFFERCKKCTAIYKKLYQDGKSIIQLTVAA